jgi:glycosyltransferase involved in cell wall biosynthesis
MYVVTKISIVIPAYNRERYLPATLESVREQTVTDWEIIVVDDGSTDGTIAIAEAYAGRDPRIRLVRQSHAGISAARNRGWKESAPTAETLIFLDSDDVWKPHALATLLNALEACPDAVGAHALAHFIDEDGCSTRPGELESWGRNREAVAGDAVVALTAAQPTTFAALIVRGFISTTGVLLLRRAAAEAAGPYDPGLVMCEDWDFWLRVSRQGPIAYVDETLLGYRWHGQNISTNLQRKRRWERVARRKLFRSRENSPDQRRMIRTAYRTIEWRFCLDKWPLLRQSVRQGQVVAGMKQFCYTMGHFARYVRSQP